MCSIVVASTPPGRLDERRHAVLVDDADRSGAPLIGKGTRPVDDCFRPQPGQRFDAERSRRVLAHERHDRLHLRTTRRGDGRVEAIPIIEIVEQHRVPIVGVLDAERRAAGTAVRLRRHVEGRDALVVRVERCLVELARVRFHPRLGLGKGRQRAQEVKERLEGDLEVREDPTIHPPVAGVPAFREAVGAFENRLEPETRQMGEHAERSGDAGAERWNDLLHGGEPSGLEAYFFGAWSAALNV